MTSVKADHDPTVRNVPGCIGVNRCDCTQSIRHGLYGTVRGDGNIRYLIKRVTIETGIRAWLTRDRGQEVGLGQPRSGRKA